MPESEEEIAYESPSPAERRQMEADEKEQAFQRLAEREAARQQRGEQTIRTTALHLAVEWTATADEVPLGAVFGIADLMIQYIETGKKPTETEFARAVKPYRR